MSKWKSVLKSGLGMVAAVYPPAALALPVVNAFLPEGEKLDPATATVDEVLAASDKVPPEKRVEFDLRMEGLLIQESTDKLRMMVDKETASENTRPEIAKMMAQVMVFSVVGMVSAVLIAVFNKDFETLKALGESWALVGVITSLPSIVIQAYFGVRSMDKKARLAAATDQSIGDATAGFMSSIVKAIRK